MPPSPSSPFSQWSTKGSTSSPFLSFSPQSSRPPMLFNAVANVSHLSPLSLSSFAFAHLFFSLTLSTLPRCPTSSSSSTFEHRFFLPTLDFSFLSLVFFSQWWRVRDHRCSICRRIDRSHERGQIERESNEGSYSSKFTRKGNLSCIHADERFISYVKVNAQET